MKFGMGIRPGSAVEVGIMMLQFDRRVRSHALFSTVLSWKLHHASISISLAGSRQRKRGGCPYKKRKMQRSAAVLIQTGIRLYYFSDLTVPPSVHNKIHQQQTRRIILIQVIRLHIKQTVNLNIPCTEHLSTNSIDNMPPPPLVTMLVTSAFLLLGCHASVSPSKRQISWCCLNYNLKLFQ